MSLPVLVLKSVGVEPKSLSPGVWFEGNWCRFTKPRFDAFNSTRANVFGSDPLQEPVLPVAMKILPVLVSMVGKPHSAPPVQPLGTKLKVFKMDPLVGSRRKNLDCIRGQSPKEDGTM